MKKYFKKKLCHNISILKKSNHFIVNYRVIHSKLNKNKIELNKFLINILFKEKSKNSFNTFIRNEIIKI